MRKKVVIIGGVAAGASCAARLRRLNESAEIVVFERGEYISFANCGLPYYIGDAIKNRSRLILRTPREMKALFNIDFRVKSEVVAVDTVGRQVRVKGSDGSEYREDYDYLVLAPGAKPFVPRIPGVEIDRVLTLRNIYDTDRIKERAAGSRSAIIIGGGYIGVEMAENLRQAGLSVSLAEAAGQILPPFDFEMANILTKELEDNGVEVFLNDGVAAFEDKGDALETTLQSGRKIISDFAVLAVGVAPDTGFLAGSGIELGERGHIKADSFLRTNAENVYAAGDAVLVKDFVNGRETAIPLAGPANKQGRIAADNICGENVEYEGSLGASVIKVFELTGASVGNNEKTLKGLGIPYRVVYAHPASHATYYPGASQIALKLLFSPEGRVLGAQGVGYEGVDKRIDVIAAVMRLGGSVRDLAKLELSYAPAYSSAKDPVNMLGFVAENVLTGKMEVATPAEIEGIDFSKAILLDVRSEAAFKAGHIKDAVHMTLEELRERFGELDREKEIYIYCNVGWTSYNGGRFLMQKGYRVKNLTGGYRTYLHFNYKPAGDSFSIGDKVSSTGEGR